MHQGISGTEKMYHGFNGRHPCGRKSTSSLFLISTGNITGVHFRLWVFVHALLSLPPLPLSLLLLLLLLAIIFFYCYFVLLRLCKKKKKSPRGDVRDPTLTHTMLLQSRLEWLCTPRWKRRKKKRKTCRLLPVWACFLRTRTQNYSLSTIRQYVCRPQRDPCWENVLFQDETYPFKWRAEENDSTLTHL